MTGNGEHFRFLGEHVGSNRVQLVALDLRGRGKSDITPPGSYGWENHARDVLAVADTLGFDRFAVVGQSMGGSEAMKAAELDGPRLNAVVLVDVAGRVDRGIGPVIAAAIRRLDRTYNSVEQCLDEIKADLPIQPWNLHWDLAYRYDLRQTSGRVVPRTSARAVAEDRAYTATQDPYSRWKHLTMPTLLLRATRELLAGSGFVVPADDRDRFLRDVPHATALEIDANHLTINAHIGTAAAIEHFLVGAAANQP
jgi:pimeloyl-ACP methyl ester carboxylesterase